MNSLFLHFSFKLGANNARNLTAEMNIFIIKSHQNDNLNFIDNMVK